MRKTSCWQLIQKKPRTNGVPYKSSYKASTNQKDKALGLINYLSICIKPICVVINEEYAHDNGIGNAVLFDSVFW